MDNLEFKDLLLNIVLVKVLKTALLTNNCAILLGILIRDLSWFRFGMVITRTWVVQLVLVAAFG